MAYTATDETPNYHLPQWLGTDSPAIREDFNQAFQSIDQGMTDNKNEIAKSQTDITTIQNTVNQNTANISNHQSWFGKLGITTDQSATEFEGRVSTLESDVTTIDESITKINSDVSGIENDINTINTTVNGKAPIMHSSSSNQYGQGNASVYGHLKLSDTANANQDVTAGVAATPKAIADIQDFINLTKTGGGVIPSGNFSLGSGSTGTLSPWMYYALNEAGTYGKLYGWVGVSGATTTNTFNVNINSGAVPFSPPETAFSVGGCALAWYYENNTVKKLTDCSVSVKPDGTITLGTNVGSISGVNLEIFMLAIPIYFKDFGDQTTPNMEFRAKMAL